MESINTQLAAQIRNNIICGTYAEGERLSETRLCETHKVSRTPVRLGLRTLESEDIIQRDEGRGYTVQSPSVGDIFQAVQVRRHLESLAARLMAQSPERTTYLPAMAKAIVTIEEYDSIKNGNSVRAEAMMREHSHIMIEYIQTFEKRDSRLTVTDLIAYSA